MTGRANIVHITAYVFLAVLIVIVMNYGAELLKPIAWASIFSFIMLPLCKKLEKWRLSRPLASLVGTLVFMISTTLILGFLVYQSVHILQNEHILEGVSKEDVGVLLDSVEQRFGLELFEFSDASTAFKKFLGIVAGKISGISQEVVILTLIPMYLFFLLNYRGLFWRFINARYEGENLEHVRMTFQKSYLSIHQYLSGTGILTVVTLVMTFLILLAFGIKYAFFFSVFLAVLNLIPFIGNLLSFAVILVFVWGAEGALYALYVGIALYAANLVQENFLRPLLVGTKMEMNAAVVFTSVIAGGLIWGLAGMVLFIPLVGIAKAFFDSNPDWKSYSVFFESK